MANKATIQFLLRLPEELHNTIVTQAEVVGKTKTDYIIDALKAYSSAQTVINGKLISDPQDVIASARLSYASSLNSAIADTVTSFSPKISNSVRNWQSSAADTNKYLSAISDLGGSITQNDD